MPNFICFLIVVLLSAQPAYGQQISGRKSAFIDHINNFLSRVVLPATDNSNTTTTRPSPTPRIRTDTVLPPVNVQTPPTVLLPFENPASVVNSLQNTALATNLVETIAAPAVRPCFIRPAFCPATSDACSNSRCARLYANGVRIGSRYYKRVKCRLNYCRETCGKAEWFADGRRLIGCSDSSSTLDNPIWSVQRVFPRPNRMDTRVLPIERVAQLLGHNDVDDTTTISVPSFILRNTPASWSGSQPQRRSVPAFIGDTGDAIEQAVDQTKDFGQRLVQKFNQIGAAIAMPTGDQLVANTTTPTPDSINPTTTVNQSDWIMNGTFFNEFPNATYTLTPLADMADPSANGTNSTQKSSAVVVVANAHLWPVVVLFLLVAL